MKEDELINEASALKTLYEETCRTPFPYQGVRTLVHEAGDRYEGLIPDLDLHFSTIAGYCSWGNRILKWNDDKVDEATARLELQFFDKHPQYRHLGSIIVEQDIQDLLARLQIYEQMRRKLLNLLKCLRREREI